MIVGNFHLIKHIISVHTCDLLCEERQNDNSFSQCQCLMIQNRKELILHGWLIDKRSIKSHLPKMGEVVSLGEKIEE